MYVIELEDGMALLYYYYDKRLPQLRLRLPRLLTVNSPLRLLVFHRERSESLRHCSNQMTDTGGNHRVLTDTTRRRPTSCREDM